MSSYSQILRIIYDTPLASGWCRDEYGPRRHRVARDYCWRPSTAARNSSMGCCSCLDVVRSGAYTYSTTAAHAATISSRKIKFPGPASMMLNSPSPRRSPLIVQGRVISEQVSGRGRSPLNRESVATSRGTTNAVYNYRTCHPRHQRWPNSMSASHPEAAVPESFSLSHKYCQINHFERGDSRDDPRKAEACPPQAVLTG